MVQDKGGVWLIDSYYPISADRCPLEHEWSIQVMANCYFSSKALSLNM